VLELRALVVAQPRPTNGAVPGDVVDAELHPQVVNDGDRPALDLEAVLRGLSARSPASPNAAWRDHYAQLAACWQAAG
jgi:hypothetical protein